MAMVGYPDRRNGRENGRHCKPGMSQTIPAVLAEYYRPNSVEIMLLSAGIQ